MGGNNLSLFELSEADKKIVDGSWAPGSENEQKAHRLVDKYNAELRKSAKKEEELIIPVELTVDSVVGQIHQSHYVTTEIVMGGRGRGHDVGDTSVLELMVNSDSVPIKVLAIPGLPPIEAGDRIRAYLFKGASKLELARYFNDERAKFFIEREFNEKEIPLKIEKLNNGGKVVATYINKSNSSDNY